MIFPAPAWVVGTYDKDGKPNAATVAWSGICCSSPPCVAVSLRAATYTHGNTLARRAFTLSVASQAHARQVDYFGISTIPGVSTPPPPCGRRLEAIR